MVLNQASHEQHKLENSSVDVISPPLNTTETSGLPDNTEIPPSSSFHVPMSVTLSSSIKKTVHPTSILKSDSSLSSLSESKQMKRTVSFDTISIREYDIVIADHPGYSGGPPIGLGWDYTSEDSFEFSTYEFKRKPRRSYCQLYLPKERRKFLLKRDCSFTDEEIKLASKRARSYRRSRSFNQALIPIYEAKEAIFGAKRSLSRRFKSSSDLTILMQ